SYENEIFVSVLYWLTGIDGDETLVEETDSERRAREDEPRRDERTEQQALAPPGPVLPPPPPVDYGVFMQGLVQDMQTQAHTQAALQAQLEAQRPQDQRFPKTSTGSSAWSASPSSSGSRASYGMTRKALSPSSSVCFSSQLALESGVESEELEVPLSVHTPMGTMKDYDAILGLDWLEEHYALVDCRRKRIVFRIPGEDEFSHPLPRNLAGKLVISAMKAMRMAFVAQLSLRSSVLDEVIEQQEADPRLLELVGKAGIARDEDGIDGDETLVEETVETDSERGV
ncbi:hypothetical protein Taro_010508, partial [Colocasia esculenta]|nr:hypothetical protein [Colocasia esculenta]